ncbi:MAG: hypothetical protein ACI9DQ_000839 [Glaciecola sp.]|jgi:hypothetical protein
MPAYAGIFLFNHLILIYGIAEIEQQIMCKVFVSFALLHAFARI